MNQSSFSFACSLGGGFLLPPTVPVHLFSCPLLIPQDMSQTPNALCWSNTNTQIEVISDTVVKGIVQHFGKYASLLFFCQELYEKIDNHSHVCTKYEAAASRWLAELSIKSGNGETASLSLSRLPAFINTLYMICLIRTKKQHFNPPVKLWGFTGWTISWLGSVTSWIFSGSLATCPLYTFCT